MQDLILVRPHCRERSKTERMNHILGKALSDYQYDTIETSDDFEKADIKGKKLIFAITLGESGINLEYYGILKKIRLDQTCLENCVAGLVIDGNSELFTKSVARNFTFSANMAGCTFPGGPLVEGTRTLENFTIVAQNLNMDNLGAYAESTSKLVDRVMTFNPPRREAPEILMLHASDTDTSNTLTLWKMIKKNLTGCKIEEISLRNGQVWDCIGCPYNTCLHFGEKNACFYGGVITEQVYPAILKCDALIMACPNYNDSINANLAAFINRLTALFRANQFYEKRLFAMIVSGYSGSDIIAEQLISALNMNKTFILPSRFAIMETANTKGSLEKLPGIEDRASAFAKNVMAALI